MKLFSYRWEDGDVSIVYARDPEQAWGILDEIGPADVERITPLRKRDFMITFSRNPTGSIEDWDLLRLSDTQGEAFVSWLTDLEALPPVADENAMARVREHNLTLDELKADLKVKWTRQQKAIAAFYGGPFRENFEQAQAKAFATIDALTEADQARGREAIAQELAGTIHAAALAQISRSKPSAKRAAASRRNGRLGGRPPKAGRSSLRVVKKGSR